MGITVKWDSSQQEVIRLDITGEWTWEEFYNAQDTMYSMMDVSPENWVDFILDMTRGNLMPKNILSHMRRVARSKHEKSRYMIVVGAGVFPQALFQVMEKITPKSTQAIALVKTLEEARTMLYHKGEALTLS